MKRMLLLFALAAAATGCGSEVLYSWGQYEDMVYRSYATPEKAPPALQIEKLEADYQRARAKHERVPPGFHAYLGYLYVQVGQSARARREFQLEKAAFPESTVFMDRLMANLDEP